MFIVEKSGALCKVKLELSRRWKMPVFEHKNILTLIENKQISPCIHLTGYDRFQYHIRMLLRLSLRSGVHGGICPSRFAQNSP